LISVYHSTVISHLKNNDYHAHAKPVRLDMLTVYDILKLKVTKLMHKVSNYCETTNPSLFTPRTKSHKLKIHNYSTRMSFITNTKSGRKSKLILHLKSSLILRLRF